MPSLGKTSTPQVLWDMAIALLIIACEVGFILVVMLVIKRLFRRLHIPLREDMPSINLAGSEPDETSINLRETELISESQAHGQTYSFHFKDKEDDEKGLVHKTFSLFVHATADEDD